MPGQRKRRRGRQEAAARAAARFAPDAGHWVTLFETTDEAEWEAYLRRIRADPSIDRSAVGIDMLCGRLVQPTTYRLRVFVPEEPETAAEACGGR